MKILGLAEVCSLDALASKQPFALRSIATFTECAPSSSVTIRGSEYTRDTRLVLAEVSAYAPGYCRYVEDVKR